MEIVRKKLDANALYDPRLSYNVSEDMVYWDELEADALDPRYTGSVPLPPATDLTCNQAATITALLRLLTEQTISSIEAGATAGQISSVILAILVVLGWVALFIAIIAALVAAAITAGATALNEAFDETTWDTLQCILFCHIDENGFLSVEALALVIEDVNEQLPTLAAAILGYYFSALGNAGLNNASLALGGLETGDCDDCECEWCYVWSSPSELVTNWTHATPSDVTDWYTASFGCNLIYAKMTYTWNGIDGGAGSNSFIEGSLSYGTNPLAQCTPISGCSGVLEWTGSSSISAGMWFGVNCATPGSGGAVAIQSIELRGIGTIPAGFTGGAEC